jgi:hypothetical protein
MQKEATNMQISEEMAVRLHRMMWSDMQRELGDNPSRDYRAKFKREWVKRNFPGEIIANDCWLCEYAVSKLEQSDDLYCNKYCPIKWPNCHCNTIGFSYANAPISDILALPARNEKFTDFVAEYTAKDKAAAAEMYYEYRESLLSKASGLPASAAIKDHVTKIEEKAVEDYFKKTPGAKLATMDVDDAFKQYAKEQMEPLKQMNDRLTKQYIEAKNYLSQKSGLDHDRPVADHVNKICDDAFSDGEDSERERIMDRIGELLNHDFD